jgi:hypothetical protein
MKYLGVDISGQVFAYKGTPIWRKSTESWLQIDLSRYEYIPAGVLPDLEPCCLYRIDKDCYTLIEDRRNN